MDINLTTRFNVGDKVWHKSFLDNYLSASEESRPFIEFYIPYMLYKIKDIKVEIRLDGTSAVLYSLDFYITPSPKFTSIQSPPQITDIYEENLYSFEEGVNAINSKIADFQNYLLSL